MNSSAKYTMDPQAIARMKEIRDQYLVVKESLKKLEELLFSFDILSLNDDAIHVNHIQDVHSVIEMVPMPITNKTIESVNHKNHTIQMIERNSEWWKTNKPKKLQNIGAVPSEYIDMIRRDSGEFYFQLEDKIVGVVYTNRVPYEIHSNLKKGFKSFMDSMIRAKSDSLKNITIDNDPVVKKKSDIVEECFKELSENVATPLESENKEPEKKTMSTESTMSMETAEPNGYSYDSIEIDGKIYYFDESFNVYTKSIDTNREVYKKIGVYENGQLVIKYSIE